MTDQARRARGCRARHNNKLSPEQVRTLRQEYRDGIRRKLPGPTMKELAVFYGITKEQVCRIITKQQWRDVA
jgi:hypothetical protein